MINTIADLLEKIKQSEIELIKKYQIIKHPVLIGNMYEGLSKELLSKSLFKNLDLHIRAGKITNSDNKFSGEIDCMLVIGEGDQIPFTDKYIYDISKVIAVFEIKKNLYSKDLKESYQNLRTVINISEPREGEKYHINLLRDSWRLICKEELPMRENLEELSMQKQMLYHVLLMEAFYPTRIVWGYEGFKSEYNFRESLIRYIEENKNSDGQNLGYGPGSFPNLIMCGEYSFVKNNGIPFAYPIDEDNWWSFYVSSPKNPLIYILEIIYTRLSYMFEISSDIFGDDLEVEIMHDFLKCRYIETTSLKGWEFKYIPLSSRDLKKPLKNQEWSPVFVDKCQFHIFNELCVRGEITYKNYVALQAFVTENGYNMESFLKTLKNTGLVGITDTVISLITDNCVCGISRAGKFYVGENKSGRVTRWAMNQISKDKV